MSTPFVVGGLVCAVAVLIVRTVKIKLHPFFALIATTVTFAVISGMDLNVMLEAFASGMGGTVADIGLVIALGTVTGALLEKSSGAEKMAKSILKITGEKHAALGLAITGYFVSIPVTIVAHFAAKFVGKKYYYLPHVEEEGGMKRPLPNTFMAFAPILVPIALMLLKTILSMTGLTGIAMDVLNVLGTPPVALPACAVGGMMVFHGSDDFFWVVTTTSDMDTSVAYKTISLISVLQSLTALLCVFLLSLVFLH